MSAQIFSRRLPSGAQTATARRTAAWLWLTLPIAVLVAIISTAGLLAPGFYRGAVAWTVQAVAQDFTDLLLVLPVLLISAVLAARGSQRGWLIWLGALSYLVYTFVIYAFAVEHNPLFLAYVAALGCALWALIGGMSTTDWTAIKARFVGRAPVKSVSLYLLAPAVLFYLMWLQDELSALLAGSTPASLKDTGLLTNPVHVLDLAVMLPAMALAGVLLWRRQTLGYGLAVLMLVNGLFQDLGIAVLMLFSIRAGLPGSLGMVAVFFALAIVNVALQVWYLRALRAPGRA